MKIYSSKNKYENFKNYTSGVQSIILSLAIIIGGGWTLYTFVSLDQIETSKNQLEQMKRELNRLAINFSINSQVISSTNKNKIGLLVEIEVTNNSEFVVYLDFKDTPLIISRINKVGNLLKPIKSYYPKYYGDINNKSEKVVYISGINPKSTHKIQFYEEVDEKGLYFISFDSKIDSSILKILFESKIGISDQDFMESSMKHLTWGADKYVEIK